MGNIKGYSHEIFATLSARPLIPGLQPFGIWFAFAEIFDALFFFQPTHFFFLWI
jgi:hypothetical protein